MSRGYLTEACVGDPQGVALAAAAGLDRAELCANLVEGGTTPSAGAIRRARALAPELGLMVMVRPRGGDFLYDEEELRVMEDDVRVAQDCGADGLVFGLLRADGSIDAERTGRLVELAAPLPVTFHRAFDVCRDPRAALDELAALGVKRVLTSGQQARSADATELLKELVDQAGERITILLGGVELESVAEVAAATGVSEVHFAALTSLASPMEHRNEAVRMGAHDLPGEYEREVTELARLQAFASALAR